MTSFYHLALDKLRFGHDFQRDAKTLTNSDAKPIRYIKTNGGRSFPFNIASGVPQGCPLSPLAFLLTAEALTRVVNEDDNIDGIIVNGAELKISQFADDTQLLAADYASLGRSLKWVDRYAAASCGKPNDTKFEGLRWGSLKQNAPPQAFRRYNWLKSSESATINDTRGTIRGTRGSQSLLAVWRRLADKIDKKVTTFAPIIANSSIHGRTKVANFLVLSIPRYWVQTLTVYDLLLRLIERREGGGDLQPPPPDRTPETKEKEKKEGGEGSGVTGDKGDDSGEVLDAGRLVGV